MKKDILLYNAGKINFPRPFINLSREKKEINTLLGDIIKHVQPDRKFENFYPQLQSIGSKILIYITDYNVLFSMVTQFCLTYFKKINEIIIHSKLF